MATKIWGKGSAGDWFTNHWTSGTHQSLGPPVTDDDAYLNASSGELDVTAADTAAGAHGPIGAISLHVGALAGQSVPLLVSQGGRFSSDFTLDNMSNDGIGTFEVLGTTAFAGALNAEMPGAGAVFTLDVEGTLDLSGTISVVNGATLHITGGGVLANTGTISDYQGTLTVDSRLDNAGTLQVLSGDLTVSGAVTGSGTLSIGDQATLTLLGATGAGQSITYASDTGLVAIGDLAAMQGVFTNLAGRDAIDLLGITATATRYDTATSLLTILDGTTVLGSLHIDGGAALNVVSDQDGGTILTLKQPGAPAQVAAYEVNGPNLSNAGAHDWRGLTPGGQPVVQYGFAAGSHFTAAEQQALVQGLRFWSAVANVSFTPVAAGQTAQVTFDDQANTPTATTATFSSGTFSAVSINFDTTVPGLTDLSSLSNTDLSGYGGFGFTTVLHEEGHMLGLYHPGNYDETVDIGTQTVFYDDSRQYSVMSYVPAALTGADDSLADGMVINASAPGLDDILAAQSIYGANRTTLAGHDVFGFNSTFGVHAALPLASYDFTQDPVPVTTLWDGGTGNTLDLSGFSQGSIVDLNPGHFSSVAGLTQNIAIAFGTAIDAVIGGDGADRLTGNTDGDTFTGGGGNDVIIGAGSGNSAIYRGAMSDYTITAGPDGAMTVADNTGQDGTDTLYDIQTLHFANATVALACYAAGTRIATPGGEVAVETLQPGDAVSLAGGGSAPVVWLGHRHIECRAHPDPVSVWPIHVAAGAFGGGLPRRALRLSPEHAVFAGGALVPIRWLTNGVSIKRVSQPSITYYHVELAAHAILLAEGLPAESWRDTGNRRMFANADAAAAPGPAAPCAPLVESAAAASGLQRALAALARTLAAA